MNLYLVRLVLTEKLGLYTDLIQRQDILGTGEKKRLRARKEV
jgi:hypothetical protein